jgi:hypothetical protein
MSEPTGGGNDVTQRAFVITTGLATLGHAFVPAATLAAGPVMLGLYWLSVTCGCGTRPFRSLGPLGMPASAQCLTCGTHVNLEPMELVRAMSVDEAFEDLCMGS